MDSNQNGPPSLHKLLASNPLRLLYFDFLKAEHSIENLLFYEACIKYNKWIPTCQDDVQKYTAAKEIYLKYKSKYPKYKTKPLNTRQNP